MSRHEVPERSIGGSLGHASSRFCMWGWVGLCSGLHFDGVSFRRDRLVILILPSPLCLVLTLPNDTAVGTRIGTGQCRSGTGIVVRLSRV